MTMTLEEACLELKKKAQGAPNVTFARVFVGGREVTPSRLERILEENGIIRFARQEHGSRTYSIVDRALAAVGVVEVNT